MAQFDVRDELAVRVAEAGPGLALREAKAEGGGLFAFFGLGSEQEAGVAGEVAPLCRPRP